jgi:DNA-binding MarR family transcriptional regulator
MTSTSGADRDSVGALSEQLPRFMRLMHGLKSQHAAEGGHDRAAHVLLFPLCRLGPLRQGALADLVHADPSTVSRHVTLLVEQGFVLREADESDGRASRLHVTAEGHAALDALRRHGVVRGRVVLVDCAYAERNARLRGPRGQPELATPDMDCFAAYMRGQADALGLPVLDTTGRPVAACLAELRRYCEELLAAPCSATAGHDERAG